MTTPAEEMRALTLAYLEDMAAAYLRSRGFAVSLHEMMLFMRTLSRDDALISRALASGQSLGRFELGVDRHLRLAS